MSPMSQAVRTEWRTVETADGDMRAYVAEVGSSPRGAVLVLQEAFGVNAHIQAVANRFASHGFLAVAPDLFHREQTPILAYDDRSTAMEAIGKLGAEQIVTDVGAVVKGLGEGHPGLPVAAVGFCFGGRAAFTAAFEVEGLAAAVSFYGPGVAAGPHAALDRVRATATRLLLLYGAEDPTISEQHRAAIDDALRAAGVDFASHVYEGAGHAFFCDARPAAFQPAAALDAWQRVSELLADAFAHGH
jgi:carboxymethylenebutenolidase